MHKASRPFKARRRALACTRKRFLIFWLDSAGISEGQGKPHSRLVDSVMPRWGMKGEQSRTLPKKIFETWEHGGMRRHRGADGAQDAGSEGHFGGGESFASKAEQGWRGEQK